MKKKMVRSENNAHQTVCTTPLFLSHRHGNISRSLALRKVWGLSPFRQVFRPDTRVSQDQLRAAGKAPLPWSLQCRKKPCSTPTLS